MYASNVNVNGQTINVLYASSGSGQAVAINADTVCAYGPCKWARRRTCAAPARFRSAPTERGDRSFDKPPVCNRRRRASGTQLWSAALSGKGVVGPIVVNGRLYTSDISGKITAWSP